MFAIRKSCPRWLVALGWLCVALPSGVELSAQLTVGGADEAKAVATLRSSTAPRSEKALACKRLAIVGTSAAVGDLGELLADPELNSWALIALEAIPGPAAEEVLQRAAQQLQGLPLVGVLNTLGVRGNPTSVPVLTEKVNDDDAEVSAAAAVALGRIANAAAAEILEAQLAKQPSARLNEVAEACVVCAERMAAAGDIDRARQLLDSVRNAPVSLPRWREATRGAILLAGEAGAPRLIELLESPDKHRFQLGLQTLREFSSGSSDESFAMVLDRVDSDRAALVLTALADRAGRDLLPLLMTKAQSASEEVRLAAIEAMGQLGDVSCVPVLLDLASVGPEDLRPRALESLVNLSDESVAADLVDRLASSEPARRALLWQLIGRRRITEAFDRVPAAMTDEAAEVRSAVLYAAGEIIPADQLPWLIQTAVSQTGQSESPAAWQALKSASVRMPDPNRCAAQLQSAIATADTEATVALLEILGAVGGTTALQALGSAALSPATEVQDAATRLLGTWNDPAVAPVLLDLASRHPVEKFRIRAVRGYLGVIRKFSMSDAERVEMCRKSCELSLRPAEQKLLADVMRLYPTTEMIEFAASEQRVPGMTELAEELRKLAAAKNK